MQGDITDFGDLDDIEPVMLILVSMLADQLQTLARLHRRGVWREDPSEIALWLRQNQDRNSNLLFTDAFAEWQLWGSPTDALLRVVNEQTPVRIDRSRLLAEAKKQSRNAPLEGTITCQVRRSGYSSSTADTVLNRRRRERRRYHNRKATA